MLLVSGNMENRSLQTHSILMCEYVGIETIFIKFSHHYFYNDSPFHIFNVCVIVVLFIIYHFKNDVRPRKFGIHFGVYMQRISLISWVSFPNKHTHRDTFDYNGAFNHNHVHHRYSTLHFIHFDALDGGWRIYIFRVCIQTVCTNCEYDDVIMNARASVIMS